ncbi:hypothetical protein CHUAL_007030 [Chamberlinius hualienensis]
MPKLFVSVLVLATAIQVFTIPAPHDASTGDILASAIRPILKIREEILPRSEDDLKTRNNDLNELLVAVSEYIRTRKDIMPSLRVEPNIISNNPIGSITEEKPIRSESNSEIALTKKDNSLSPGRKYDFLWHGGLATLLGIIKLSDDKTTTENTTGPESIRK